ncbi:MAG: M48 family metallopeptidase [Flammeovirgaceae bacterium]
MNFMLNRGIISIVCTVLFVFSCTTNPVTGRKQLSLIPASQMHTMSFQQYSQFLNENKVSADAKNTEMIKRVGNRIQTAVEAYMAEIGHSDRLEGFQWEFNLIDDPTQNAWCMPGGKVVFYTGILPICKDEEGVAVVMGHEVAHAVANHGGERMSQAMAVQLGGVGLQVAMTEKPALTQNLFLQAFGVGSQLGMLKFSRSHESEADEMGLYFSAMAGYDPQHAPAFWERMKAASGGQAPPEFLSTHPSNDTRIQQLNALMPKAMELYEKYKGKY